MEWEESCGGNQIQSNTHGRGKPRWCVKFPRGAGAAAAFARGGGILGGLAGVTAGGASAVVGAAEASLSGSAYSPMGSILSSLAHQRDASRKRRRNDPTDLSGDKAVEELLRGRRK